LKNKLQTVGKLIEPPSGEPKETSIDLAYKISIDYMDTAISRFDKIDEKIQTIFTFSIGIFAVAPTLLKTNSADKINGYFWTGIGCLIAAGIVSICARLYGKLTIANPKKIQDNKGLELTPNNFKKSIVKLAADAYEENSKVLENKHRLNILSMAIFGSALILLVYWLVTFAM
jgi:hypothetical protein